MKTKLDKLRQKLDKVDHKILAALAERFKIVLEVSKFKKANNIKPLDQKRWNFVIKNRKLIGKSLGLSPKFVKNVFEEIHKEALKIERKTIKNA
ncbi:MAG TPA: chorismate mutase [Alphaproteobacteria bacterium]|jgi:chorismate mutase|nr:chorismate mutase [Alphaproteobacteria bacterium]